LIPWFRAVNFKSQGVEADLVGRVKQEAMAAIDRAVSAIQGLRVADDGAIDKGMIEQSKAAILAYLEAAKQVAETVEADAFTATMMLNDSDLK
jgi:hypothetical protein